MRAALVGVSMLLLSCRSSPPIPPADRPPWQALIVDSNFRIAMDTSHVTPGSPGTSLVWFVTTHAAPRGPDSMRFDRGRIQLLVRCRPLSFKSVSEELALGDRRPIFHKAWPQRGPDSATWRAPDSGATDDQFLRAACAILEARR